MMNAGLMKQATVLQQQLNAINNQYSMLIQQNMNQGNAILQMQYELICL
ncbi:hypothetical protein TVAG_581610 [Trichomonas vaginalis G3]|uniref:Uncharacterized protein n=1 Tax=Trichomonas vaginalis (strain ATCC PRA-98 / G3) TaxID=412133 RepID=A2GMV5_TRIV3|nr:hypothetical protein TVAG_581610 [Trichomonas vaginalis G3]|eukprot:XP_001294443.1 hypothetical protein [Trichomonas vaginalis G3]